MALFSIAQGRLAIDAELPSKLATPNHVAMPREENLARSLGVSADFMRSVQQVCAEQRFTPPASLDVHHARRAPVVSSRMTKLTSSFLSADRVAVHLVDYRSECVVHPPLQGYLAHTKQRLLALAPLPPLRLPRPSSAEKLTGSDRWSRGKFDEPIDPGESFVIRSRFPSAAMRHLKLGALDDAHHDAALATPSSLPLKHKVIRCASEPRPRVSTASKHPRGASVGSYLSRRVSTTSQHPGAISVGSLTTGRDEPPHHTRHDSLASSRRDSVASSSSTRRDSLVSIGERDAHCAPEAAWSGKRLCGEPPGSSEEEPSGQFSQLL